MGYGGTKTEMQRLIKDANAWAKENGKAADLSIDKFSDVVTAIQYIQEAQGIAGTTAREAMTTIEGPVNAAKSAWANLITEIGKPDADLPARVGDLMDAIFGVVDKKTGEREGGVLRNVTKEVMTVTSNIANGVGTAIEQGSTYLFEHGPEKFGEALGRIKETVAQKFEEISSTGFDFDITSAIFGDGENKGLIDKVGEFVGEMKAAWDEHGPEIMEMGRGILTTIVDGIIEEGGEFASKVVDTVMEGLPEGVQEKIDVVGEKFSTLWEKGQEAADKLSPYLGDIKDKIAEMADNGVSKLQELSDQFVNMSPEEFSQAIDDAAAKFEEWLPFIAGVTAGIVAFNAAMAVSAGLAAIKGVISGIAGAFSAFNAVLAANPVVAVVTALAMLSAMLVTAYNTNEDFRNKVNAAWGAVKEVVGGAVEGITSFFEGVRQGIADFGDMLSEKMQAVIDFFGGIADFIKDPIGSIQNGLSDVSSSFEGLSGSTSSSMDAVEGALGRGAKATQDYSKTPLKSKKATASVSGNAVDGSGKKSVGDTDSAVQHLKGKSVDVEVRQKGLSASAINGIRDAISKLKDKNITLTTHQNTVKRTTVVQEDRAWGGIRRHARGDIVVANNPGPGIPLDIVGEAGPEAIVPLTSRYGAEFAEMMGREAAKVMGGKPSVAIYLTYNAGEDAAQLVSDIADGLALVL